MENDPANIAPFAGANPYVTKVVGVANAIAYYFSRGGGPIIALGLAITGLFLPDVLAAYGKVAAQIGSHIFATIDNAILKYAVANADANLIRFSEYFGNLNKLFDLWQKGPSEWERDNAKSTLRTNYQSFVVDKLPDMKAAFVHAQYGGFMLSHFAAAASQYLSVLHLYYAYAEELDLPATAPRANNRQDLVLQKWRRDLADIINTGVASYRLGLQNILRGEGGYRRSWDDYNGFRNAVAITGMDVLAVLQYNDPLLYRRKCNCRNWNRKLLTFLDASADNSRALEYRSSIQFMEDKYNPRTAVAALQRIELFQAQQMRDPLAGPAKDMDGLIGVQCTMVACDGSSAEFPMAYSGWLPQPSSVRTQLLVFSPSCYWITGRHRYRWIASSTQPAIAEMSFYLEYNKQRFFDFSATQVLPQQVREFSSTVPETTDTQPHWGDVGESHQHRLVNMLVDVSKTDEVHSYVFSWHHLSVLQDLLPQASHLGVPADSVMMEQFHAIRALSSIRMQNLAIVGNPGFTGGDLVELKAQQFVEFDLKRRADRWFAGRYEVRLWCLVPSDPVAIDVDVIPEGNFSLSRARISITETRHISDVNALKFEDLISVPMSGELLITDSMTGVKLQLRNMSASAFVVVDRIELTFVGLATAVERRTSETL